MLSLLARRARVQALLLAAVLAVVVIGTTLLGVCALLLTTSQERGLDEAMSRTTAAQVDVTAFTTDVSSTNAVKVAADTRTVVTAALAPFTATTATRASSAMRVLLAPGAAPRRVGYLSGLDDLPDRARLTGGRWPRAAGAGSGRLEAAVLEPTARVLDLSLGDRVRLGAEAPVTDVKAPLTVVVVGIVAPLPDTGWDRDPLAAAGYDPNYRDGGPLAKLAVGPFLVDLSDLYASGSTIGRLQVNAHPDLSAPTSAGLDAAAGSVAGAGARLGPVLGTRVGIQRVGSDLPATLGLAHEQLAVTRSTVLVVVLLGTALTGAALGLAGRLIAGVRAGETALLSTLGARRGQLALAASTEALVLAAIAALLAVPLSALAHAGLTHLPTLNQAGLAARPSTTPAQVGAVAAGALLFAAVLAVPALRSDPAQAVATRSRLGLLTRSGADLALVALALVGWWQLRAQPAGGTGPDTVRTLAPVLCVLAGAALALRALAPPLWAGEWLARRSRALVLPLAAFEAARRPRAVAAGLLIAMAAGTGSFALAFDSTWHASQQDQADARVGTDLALDLTAPAAPGQGPVVAAATGGTLSPATDRGVAVGQWLGNAGNAPRLVAVDAARAGSLLRGRAPADSCWARVGAGLAPATAVTGVRLPAGSDPGLTLTGSSSSSAPLAVTPRLVLQDAQGLRTPCTAPAVRLDRRAHPVRLCSGLDLARRQGLSVVALALQVQLDDPNSAALLDGSSLPPAPARITASLRVPAVAGAPSSGRWSATSIGTPPERLIGANATVRASGDTTVVRTEAVADLIGLPYESVQVLATAFARPAPLPVAVSASLAGALGTRVGGRLTVTLGTTPVPVTVDQVVASIPGAPGQVAMLTDSDLLSRALIATGDLEPAVNAWWVARPSRPDAATAAAALGLGTVRTRAGVSAELSGGPLRVGLPAALLVLLPAVVLLLLAGMLMHVAADVDARAVDIARLRGLGLSRRTVRAGLLAQHGGVLGLLLLAGAGIGAVTAAAVAPLLIRSDLGAAPVPAATTDWPWPRESAFLLGVFLACTLSVALVVAVQLRRADAAHLRVDG